MNDDVVTRSKPKLRQTCYKYSRIKVPYQNSTVINNLGNNKQLIILKQDKMGGSVLLGKKKVRQKVFFDYQASLRNWTSTQLLPLRQKYKAL